MNPSQPSTFDLRTLRQLLKRVRSESPSTLPSGAPDLSELSHLLSQARLLVHRLVGRVRMRTLRRMLAGFTLLLGVSTSHAQTSFATEMINPFGLAEDSMQIFPTFSGLDGDGDLDVLIGRIDGRFAYMENTGSATNPAFITGPANPFGLSDHGTGNDPTLVDLDGDGDLDLMTSEGVNLVGFYYYQNVGTSTQPMFAPRVANPFGLTFNQYRPTPAFADLDNDGDFDMLSGEFNGNFLYYENTGTATAPAFAAPVTNPFGLVDTQEFDSNPEFVDLDGDGDMDIFSGGYSGGVFYFENIGTASAPAYGNKQASPFGISFSGGRSAIAAGDLDGDSDPDLLIGADFGDLHYFENVTPVGIEDQLASQLSIWPNPSEGAFTVSLPEELSRRAFSVELLNAQGQLVWSQSYLDGMEGDELPIDLRGFDAGVYWLKFSQQGRQIGRSLLKQ